MPAGQVTPYDRRALGRYSGAVATYKRLTKAAHELTKQMKQRGIYPKTALERKGISLTRKGRKIPAVRTVRSELNAQGGDYSQFTEKRIKTGRRKRNTLRSVVKEIRNKNETTIFRFSGMRPGPNDYGYYWCSKRVNGANTDMPLYMFDLTTINNVVAGSAPGGAPCYRCSMVEANGSFVWTNVSCQNINNTGLQTTWVDEKLPSSSATVSYPHEKSRLLWTDVRLNLYGTKERAIKWTVSVVKLIDETLDPAMAANYDAGTIDYKRHIAFWQGFLKPKVYNPLALTSAGQMRGLKVLKTYSFIVQPTSTTESDTNPHTKILKWFSRWERDLSYTDRGAHVTTGDSFHNDADYSQEVNQTNTTTEPKHKIWLMISCNDYTAAQETQDNNKHASFDLFVRACHVAQ